MLGGSLAQRCTRIALLLVVGATTNLLVAWGAARWASDYPLMWFTEARPAQRLPDGADEYLNSPSYMKGFGPGRLTGLDVKGSSSLVCTRTEYQRWHDYPDLAYSRSHVSIQFGFPFRSMEYEETSWFDTAAYPEFGGNRLSGCRGGWPLRVPGEGNFGFCDRSPPRHVYPITVVPLGFASDTLVYAALVYGAFIAPWAARRWSRGRRGLCLKCAYPIGVSPVCSECGAAFAPHSAG